MFGTRALTILQFHNITDRHRLNRLWLPPQAFLEQLRFLQQSDAEMIGMADAVSFMKRDLDFGKKRPISLTFDHGYADFERFVFPLLEQGGMPATVLISPEKVGGSFQAGGETTDHLNSTQLRSLAERGVTVGAYEDAAWNINQIDPAAVCRHVREYKGRLEDITGREVKYFGVKEGVPSTKVRDLLIASGYDAFLTQCPTNRRPDPYAIGRIQVDDDDFNIFRTKISRTYLFFKDKRSWKYIREYKLDRLAHRFSETLDRFRGIRHDA